MGTYALYFDARYDREPVQSFTISDGDVAALGVSPDPYVARQVWTLPELEVLRIELDYLIAALANEATTAVLNKTHRHRLEAWMEPMLTAQLDGDSRLAHARQLLALVRLALANRGTVIFWGD